MLHGEGVETGIDLDALIDVAGWLEGVLGRQLRGQVYRAGVVRAGRGLSEKERHGMAYRLGVDVGGTFTDLFLVDDSNGGGAVTAIKTPSTPADPSEGRAQRRPPHLRGGRRSTSATSATSSTGRPSRRTPCSSRRAPAWA